MAGVDICNPPLLWLEGRCYRLGREQEREVVAGYTGETEAEDWSELGQDGAEVEVEIEQLTGGRWRAALQLPATLFPQIIGKGGQTKGRIEADTRTKVVVPGKGKEGEVVITGTERRGVEAAASRVTALVEAARSRQPFTHFISIPCNSPATQESFLQFRAEVLEKCGNCRGLDQSIFQTETLLHITVGTLVLLDEREREKARELLLDCKENLVLPLLGDSPQLEFGLHGLEIMNDDEAEVDVLYCGVTEPTGRLQQLADALVEKFVEAGLMRREHDQVKLHVTVLNSLFRREEENSGPAPARETFDSRAVMAGWGGLRLGRTSLQEIHLSQRRAGRRTKAGYYLPSAVLQLNTCG